jgi:hydrogenase/urease accessory protein HupE
VDIDRTAATGWFDFIELGIKHILTGYDHLLFLVALLATARSVWSVVRFVTASTLAHSVTLSVAATGIVTVPGRIIEPLIAATIVWVALENLFAAEPERGRWIWSFGFGLVHGLGFASALGELGPKGAVLVRGLVGFNFGCRDRAAALRRRLPAATDLADTRARRAAGPAHRVADGSHDWNLLVGRPHLCRLRRKSGPFRKKLAQPIV